MPKAAGHGKSVEWTLADWEEFIQRFGKTDEAQQALLYNDTWQKYLTDVIPELSGSFSNKQWDLFGNIPSVVRELAEAAGVTEFRNERTGQQSLRGPNGRFISAADAVRMALDLESDG